MAEHKKIVLAQFGDVSHLLTVRYLSGILRASGYDTTIVSVSPSKSGGNVSWSYGEYTLSDGALQKIKELSKGALFIGITLFTFEAHLVKRLYDSFTDGDRIPIVVGGPHPTLDPLHSACLADYVCIGDGERGIVQFADMLIGSQKTYDLSGYQKSLRDGEICENIFKSSFLKANPDIAVSIQTKESFISLNVLPTYTFDSEYSVSDAGVERITKENASKYIAFYGTFFSKGCVFNCTYCAHEAIALKSGFQKRVKSKTVDKMLEELSFVKTNYPWIKQISFFDPNILSNKRDDLFYLLERYKKEINLPFNCTGFTFNQVNEDILRAFLEAGLKSVIFGVESGSEKTRQTFGRDYEKTSTILRVDSLLVNLKKEYVFNVQYDVILDVPWDTQEDVIDSLRFFAKLQGSDYLDIFSLRLFPKTKLFERALKEGLINFQDRSVEYRKTYRGLQPKYENMLFMALRDGLITNGLILRILSNKIFARKMGALFSGGVGKIFFKIYVYIWRSFIGDFFHYVSRIRNIVHALGFVDGAKYFIKKIKSRTV